MHSPTQANRAPRCFFSFPFFMYFLLCLPLQMLCTLLSDYLSRLSGIIDNKLNCGPVLSWMEVRRFRSEHYLVLCGIPVCFRTIVIPNNISALKPKRFKHSQHCLTTLLLASKTHHLPLVMVHRMKPQGVIGHYKAVSTISKRLVIDNASHLVVK